MSLVQRPPRRLLLASALVYLTIVAALIFQVRQRTGGHFVYALDDPYIHLALAQQIAHGHYGINPGEPASPSSSLLWPLLLVPFASHPWQVYLPLFWNILFGLCSTSLLALIVARWPTHPDGERRTAFWKQLLITVLLMLIANLFTLTLIGMEHSLQVLLTIACAWGILTALDGDEIPTWCLAAAVAAPMVRYEDLSLTLAICIALAVQQRIRRSLTVAALSVLPLILFAWFLRSIGLPGLPTSVLIKGNIDAGNLTLLQRTILTAHADLFMMTHDPVRFYAVLVIILFLIAFTLQRTPARRIIVGGAGLVPILQLLVGRFGWLHRYEVYALIFSAIILLRLFTGLTRFRFPYMVLGLAIFAYPSILITEETARAAADIYFQQYQMHRFENDFYRGNIAVNDLGLVSYRRPPGVYVLDLVGLASLEAAQQKYKTAAWLDAFTARHNVDLAILYPQWFNIPPSWVPLATLCRPSTPVFIERCAVFYSTSPAQLDQLREELQRFSRTLPPEAILTLNSALPTAPPTASPLH